MRLDKPEKLFGTWPESQDRGIRQSAQSTMGGLKRYVEGEPTSAVGTAWEAPDGRQGAVFSGVSGKVRDPQRALDMLFAAPSLLAEVRSVPVGPMGGAARCGRFQPGNVAGHVCGWTDSDTIGRLMLVGGHTPDEAEELFRQARASLEHRAG